MPAQSFGLPTAGIKQAALHNDKSNNRNSWTATVTHKLRELGFYGGVNRLLWHLKKNAQKLSFTVNMEIYRTVPYISVMYKWSMGVLMVQS